MSNGKNSQVNSMLLSIIDIKQEVIEDDTPPDYTPFTDHNYQAMDCPNLNTDVCSMNSAEWESTSSNNLTRPVKKKRRKNGKVIHTMAYKNRKRKMMDKSSFVPEIKHCKVELNHTEVTNYLEQEKGKRLKTPSPKKKNKNILCSKSLQVEKVEQEQFVIINEDRVSGEDNGYSDKNPVKDKIISPPKRVKLKRKSAIRLRRNGKFASKINTTTFYLVVIDMFGNESHVIPTEPLSADFLQSHLELDHCRAPLTFSCPTNTTEKDTSTSVAHEEKESFVTRRYKCGKCSLYGYVSFKNPHMLKLPHCNGNFVCEFCQITFKKRIDLESHIIITHAPNKQVELFIKNTCQCKKTIINDVECYDIHNEVSKGNQEQIKHIEITGLHRESLPKQTTFPEVPHPSGNSEATPTSSTPNKASTSSPDINNNIYFVSFDQYLLYKHIHDHHSCNFLHLDSVALIEPFTENDKKDSMTCLLCKIVFTSFRQFVRHFEKKHATKKIQKKYYQCKLCDSCHFNHAMMCLHLQCHKVLDIQFTTKKHACNDCFTLFNICSTSESLKPCLENVDTLVIPNLVSLHKKDIKSSGRIGPHFYFYYDLLNSWVHPSNLVIKLNSWKPIEKYLPLSENALCEANSVLEIGWNQYNNQDFNKKKFDVFVNPKIDTPIANPDEEQLNGKIIYACNLCSNKYKFKHTLRRHIKKIHNLQGKYIIPKPIISNEIISNIRPNVGYTINNMNINEKYDVFYKHIFMRHHNTKEIINSPNLLHELDVGFDIQGKMSCLICKCEFEDNGHLEPHFKEIHKESIVLFVYQCKLCNCCYCDYDKMYAHLNTHHILFGNDPKGKDYSSCCLFCHRMFNACTKNTSSLTFINIYGLINIYLKYILFKTSSKSFHYIYYDALKEVLTEPGKIKSD